MAARMMFIVAAIALASFSVSKAAAQGRGAPAEPLPAGQTYTFIVCTYFPNQELNFAIKWCAPVCARTQLAASTERIPCMRRTLCASLGCRYANKRVAVKPLNESGAACSFGAGIGAPAGSGEVKLAVQQPAAAAGAFSAC